MKTSGIIELAKGAKTMYRVEDWYGNVRARVEDLRDAKRLAIGFGVDMVHQTMRQCEETDEPMEIELQIFVYPYNGKNGQSCFHVFAGQRGLSDDSIEQNYYNVVVED